MESAIIHYAFKNYHPVSHCIIRFVLFLLNMHCVISNSHFNEILGICLVISIIILGLHLKERREDKLEKLQEAQRFHFDAM